jgi:hypothetical protein
MAFSRNSMVATVAGSLSIALLAGCPTTTTPPVATPTPGTGTPTVAPTMAPSMAPTNGPTAAPTTPTGSPGASTVPTTPASAPAPTGKTTIVGGNVYDEAGATVDGAVVKVNSLDTSVPYTASTTTASGSYVVNNVPEGANVEIIVSKDGWTSRRRVGSFQTQSTIKNEVNFGGNATNTNGTADAGQAYFISKYPEITAVDPVYDASNVSWQSVSYKMTLSEALDDVNRRRFEDAVRLFPANSYAVPENDNSTTVAAVFSGATGPSLGGQNPQAFNLKDQKLTVGSANSSLDRMVEPTMVVAGSLYSAPTTPNHANSGATPDQVPWDYAIKKGTLFLDDSTTRAAITWNADFTQATLTFAAPLIADRTNNAKYQVGLVAPSATDKIVDKDNNQLGTDSTGSLQNYPAVGRLIHGTVRQPDLALNQATSAGMRWIQTHQDAALFSTEVDSKDPKLTSVAYTKNLGASSRFEFTFDEPMAAYNGRSGGHVHTALRDGSFLRFTTIAVSDRAGGTKNVNLKGTSGSGNLVVTTTNASFGNSSTYEKEHALAGPNANQFPVGLANYGTAVATAEGANAAGTYLVTIDPRNPKTVFVYVLNVQNMFTTNVTELKARVEGISDPAGNSIKSADADNNQLGGSI